MTAPEPSAALVARSRPFWHRVPKHQHLWTVIAEHFTPPGGEIGPFNMKGRAERVAAAMQAHYRALERIQLGATTLVYECSCGERWTSLVTGDARKPAQAEASEVRTVTQPKADGS